MYCGKHKGDIRNIYRRWFYRWLINKFLVDCETILDIGCGTGMFVDVANKCKKQSIGIDLDDSNIRSHILKLDYRKINTKFDCCLNSQFIEHVNQFEFMEKMQKICNDIIITITPRNNRNFWHTPDHIRPYTPQAIKQLYEAYGFKTIFSLQMYPTDSFIVVGKKIKMKEQTLQK